MLFERYGFVAPLTANIEAAGLRRPTDIQFRAIPAVLDGNDLLAIAQTGTGKTLAFALPIIERLAREPRQRGGYAPRAIVMAPTHELAKQLYRVIAGMSKGTGVVAFCVVGGYGLEEQLEALPSTVDIVVGTPGRLNDLARNRNLELGRVRYLVLDEADRMLDLGFREDIDHVVSHLPRFRQTLFFSATISPEIKRLARRLISKNAIRIEIAPDDIVSKNVSHGVLFVPQDEKRFFLERLVRNHEGEKILAFVRTQVRAERVVKAMERVEIDALLLHGGLDREAREAALCEFTHAECPLLIATDVSARGLDIPGIGLVVNYDMPQPPEVYVHRIGRTGRGSAKGTAISFCSEGEEKRLEAIEKLLGYYIPRVSLDETQYEEVVDFSLAAESDWRTLMDKHVEEQQKAARKKKRKKRK